MSETSEKVRHTQLPWRVRQVGRYIEVRAAAKEKPVVAWPGFDDADRNDAVHLANADLIVRAVNSHDELLAACKLAQRWLANCVPTVELDGPKPMPVLDRAIALAEGRAS